MYFCWEKADRTRSTNLAACYADQLSLFLLRWKMQAPRFSTTTRTIVWTTSARTTTSNTITITRTRRRKPFMNYTSIVSVLVYTTQDIIYCLCWVVRFYLGCLFTLVRFFLLSIRKMLIGII